MKPTPTLQMDRFRLIFGCIFSTDRTSQSHVLQAAFEPCQMQPR